MEETGCFFSFHLNFENCPALNFVNLNYKYNSQRPYRAQTGL